MQKSYLNTTKPGLSPSPNGMDHSSRLFNGLTSTPLSSPTSRVKNSFFLTHKLTPLRSPPLYSLSEVPNTSNKSPRVVQNVAGPLLASTRFNVNLGTYTDSKSPGLSNRIVQYSNEAKQRQAPTHQAKYGSPGLFPIVHFFKRDIPTISPKPRKVTVKIASPDTSWYSSPTYGTRKISNNCPNLQNGHSSTQSSTDTETRSVLDALKEISRKRIHTSGDFEVNPDICKRQKRTENVVNTSLTSDCNKRTREDSPIFDSPTKSPVQPAAKKICVVDLLAASFTSSQLLKDQIEKGLKRKDELEGMKKTPEKPTVLLNVSTQTTETPKIIDVKTIDNSEIELLPEENKTSKKKSEKAVHKEEEDPYRYAKIFDDKRLEINRKNKLAVLLSAVTKQPPVLIPYEKPSTTSLEPEDTELSSPPPKLVSILSPQNKPKHDKHVTFNLPPENSNECVKSTTQPLSTDASSNVMTATADTTPIKIKVNIISAETPKSTLSTPTVTKLDFGVSNSNTIIKVNENKVDTGLSKSIEEVKSTETQSSGFSFKRLEQTNITSPASTVTLGLGAAQNVITTTTDFAPTTLAFPISKDTSPKSGGFKFDLNKTESTVTTSNTILSTSTPQFLFGTNPAIASSTSELNTRSIVSSISLPTATPAPGFSFGATKTTSSTQVTSSIPSVISFTATSATAPSPKVTSPILSMANTNNVAKTIGTSSSNILNFGSTLQGFNNANNLGQSSLPASSTISTVTTTPFSIPNTLPFGPTSGTVSNNTFEVSLSTNQLPSCAFSAQSSNPSFGSHPPNPVFGGISTGQVNSTFSSAITTASGVNFSNATTTASSGFSDTSLPVFAQPNTNPLGFGTSKTTPSFGGATLSVFGTTTTSSLTSTTGVPMFGSSQSVEPTFNTSSAPAPSIFGSNNQSQSFNTTTTSSGFDTALGNKPFAFGANNNTNNNSTIFNATVTKPSFNFVPSTTSTNAAFTTKSIPSFGSTFTTANAFGSTTANTVTTSSIFNSQSSTFGSTVTQFGPKTENVFGSKTENTFGAKPEKAFGAKPENAFGAKVENAFGAKVENVFGAKENVFGAKPENSFGAKPENAFAAKPQNAFGAKPQNAFGAKSESSFGAKPESAKPENTFGSFNNSIASSGNAPTFGTNNNSNMFGATNNAFGTNTSNASSFGATGSNSNAFGTNQNRTPAFGAAATNNNFVTTPASNIFGANTTVSNSFGNPNAFGNTTGAPMFGFNSGDTNSAFVKPQPSGGVFGSSGAGDTTFQFGNNVVTNSGFGTTTAAPTAGQAGIFAFGTTSSSTTTPAAGVFAFGTSEDKPAFNFNTSNTAFGGGSPSTFNATPGPNFNPGGQQFGAAPAGVFSIGSGSSTGNRSRTQLRAKRRV